MLNRITLTTSSNSTVDYNPETGNVHIHDLAKRSGAEIPFSALDEFVTIVKAAAGVEGSGRP